MTKVSYNACFVAVTAEECRCRDVGVVYHAGRLLKAGDAASSSLSVGTSADGFEHCLLMTPALLAR